MGDGDLMVLYELRLGLVRAFYAVTDVQEKCRIAKLLRRTRFSDSELEKLNA